MSLTTFTRRLVASLLTATVLLFWAGAGFRLHHWLEHESHGTEDSEGRRQHDHHGHGPSCSGHGHSHEQDGSGERHPGQEHSSDHTCHWCLTFSAPADDSRVADVSMDLPVVAGVVVLHQQLSPPLFVPAISQRGPPTAEHAA